MRPEPRYPVLLHGFTGSSASWGAEIVDGLSSGGLPPLLVDLPGHGRDAGNADASDFTLDATLARLGEVDAWPADLVGYSMGGRIALHFAATYPERVTRLVLESSSPGLATEAERAARRATDEALAERILSNGVSAFVDAWESQPIFESRARMAADVVARQRELRLRNRAASLAAALVGLGTGALPSLWQRLADVTVPTLLVVGALDEKFVSIAERMAEVLPDARIAVVPGAGHTVHLERPDAWVGAVSAFLRA